MGFGTCWLSPYHLSIFMVRVRFRVRVNKRVRVRKRVIKRVRIRVRVRKRVKVRVILWRKNWLWGDNQQVPKTFLK